MHKQEISEFSENRNLYLAAGISLIVLLTGLYILTVKYIIPVYNNDITFIHDFSFYKSAAERFLSNPAELYKTTDLQQEIAYIYPPPAVFIFLPFAGAGLFPSYLFFLIFSLVFLIAAIFLFVKSAELLLGNHIQVKQKILIWIIAAGNAPVYMNFQSSQVGTLLFFLIALFLYLLILNKNFISGIILSLSILIKLYPLLMLFISLKKDIRKLFITGLLSGLIIIPVISLLFIPLSVYKDFIFQILPGLNNYTESNVYNQSFIPILLRFLGYADGSWALIEIPVSLKIINSLLFAAIVLFAGYRILSSSLIKIQIVYSLIIMAAIPVFSTFGWGHLYILAMPLIITIMVRYKHNIWILPLFLVFAVDIPDSAFLKLHMNNTPILYHLFHARFMITTLLAIIITTRNPLSLNLKGL